MLYERQEELDVNPPESAVVVGVGGVGSWVALNLALSGAGELILIDDDVVEDHNLNRTPFRLSDVGKTKVEALTELIMERREIRITPLDKKFEDLNQYDRELVGDKKVIDFRDTSEPLAKKVVFTGGYDGMSVTLHAQPDYENIWGEGQEGYEITPSWLIPPQFIANMVVLYLCCQNQFADGEWSKTFDIKEVLKKLIK